MKLSNLVAGLDLGSSKFCMSVGQYFENGGVEILDTAVTKAQGVKDGVIIDLKEAAQCIEEVFSKIKIDKNFSCSSVVMTINGDHLIGDKVRNFLTLSGTSREITKEDIANLLHSTRSLHTYIDREVVYDVVQDFGVDAKGEIRDPLGMHAAKLTVNLYLITALSAQIKNLTKTVNLAGLDVRKMVVSAIASSKSALTDFEKDNGVILLEIGAGTTQILFIHGQKIRGFEVIPYGGNAITADIASEFRIANDEAERIKIEYSSVDFNSIDHEEKIILIRGGRYESILRKQLVAVIESKIRKLLNDIVDIFETNKYKRRAKCGVVITGGVASTDGLLETAQKVFCLPVRLGVVRGVTTNLRITNPAYAAAIGAVIHGLECIRHDNLRLTKHGRGVFGLVKRRLVQLYEEYF
ncbi:MAG: cell division protein FtsA [Candidatus Omnitrophota bacterium]